MPMSPDKSLSDLNKRVISGMTLVAILLTVFILGGWWLKGALMIIGLMCVTEMYKVLETDDVKPVKWAGIVLSAASLPAWVFFGAGGVISLFAVVFIAAMAKIVIDDRPGFDRVTATVFPMLYPAFMFSFIYPIVDIKDPFMFRITFIEAVAVTFLNDAVAYLVGCRIGKRHITPHLSPKKSLEGTLAGIIASVIVAVLVPFSARFMGANTPALWHYAILGLLIGIVSFLGDLTASLIKRHFGIKDYGKIMPGHGGMMDRMDSLLFTAPVVYIYMVLLLGI